MYFYPMSKTFFFIILLIISNSVIGQKKDSLDLKNGIDKPSLLPTHHFGIFSARINQNFKIKPPQKATLHFSYASGNSFHPFVEMYIPKDETTRQQMSQLTWFDRHFWKDQKTTPAEYENIIIDAVFKEFRIDFNTRIAKNHELGITLRSYLVTKGKYPFSFFASDESIEWFHSNIAGGEDPFGRRYYGLNQVNVRYQDRNGRKLELSDGQFLVAGIELNHFYYPNLKSLKRKNIYLNFGSHFGINTSKHNPSIDLGLSSNIVKKWSLKNTNEIRAAFGTALLRKNAIRFKESVVLGNNNYLGSFEAMFEFTKYTKKGNYNSISVNYNYQTRFNKLEEYNYLQLIGKWQEINAGWQNGFQQLYFQQSAWTWVYTYGKENYKLSLYLREDLLVNNAPDIQTGISLKIPLFKK